MDDHKVYELARLRLAYQKQMIFISALIVLALFGIVLYVINIIQFNEALLIIAIVMIVTGIIGVMTIDQKMKAISKKIKGL
jgi:hypothetical protein